VDAWLMPGTNARSDTTPAAAPRSTHPDRIASRTHPAPPSAWAILAFDKMWDNGYRQVTSSTHPINVPEDFKGFKIRVPVSPLWTSMFRRFGATAMTINFSEVYNALKTKFVDGQENPLSLIEAN
jgi:hypothetical protein